LKEDLGKWLEGRKRDDGSYGEILKMLPQRQLPVMPEAKLEGGCCLGSPVSSGILCLLLWWWVGFGVV
jgi:hypothetical protein